MAAFDDPHNICEWARRAAGREQTLSCGEIGTPPPVDQLPPPPANLAPPENEPDGITINEVAWTISGGDMEPMRGTIDTSAQDSTASLEVFGLPPGSGYLVEFEATDETGTVMCKGDAEFEVKVGVATDVMVMLNCKRPTTLGGVRVNGQFNICAQIAKVVVSPLQTSVGNDIDLFEAGEDVEGDEVTVSDGDVTMEVGNGESYTMLDWMSIVPVD